MTLQVAQALNGTGLAGDIAIEVRDEDDDLMSTRERLVEPRNRAVGVIVTSGA